MNSKKTTLKKKASKKLSPRAKGVGGASQAGQVLCIPAEAVFRLESPSEFWISNLVDRIYSLSDFSAVIWKTFAMPMTSAQAIEILAEKFDLSASQRSEVQIFIQKLLKEKLVEVQDPNSKNPGNKQLDKLKLNSGKFDKNTKLTIKRIDQIMSLYRVAATGH